MTTISAPTKAIFIALIFLLVVLVNFFAQTPQPSPITTPEPSPSASPSPTPARAPTPTPLPGAQNFHQWGSVTVFNGLPSDSVRAIAQTPDGVMWFGTDNGLARFDGRQVQRFSPGGSETDQVLVLKVADDGDLWIGTRSGAFVHSGNQFREVTNTRGSGITAILLGHDRAFLGSDTGFIFAVARGEGGIPVANVLSDTPIRTVEGAPAAVTGFLSTENDDIIASTAGRGFFLVGDRGIIESREIGYSAFINAVVRDEDQTVWTATDAARNVSGVSAKPHGKPWTRIAAPTATVLSINANDGGVWAGTERFGLFHFAGTKLKKSYTFENTSGGLRSNTIYALFTDREGVVWIGTNRGVSRFDRLGASQETVSDIPNSNFIRTLYRTADGKLYAGSNRGLFEKVGDKWVEITAYRNRPIYSLAQDNSGKLLVGSVERNTDTRSFAQFRGGTYTAVAGVGLVQIRSGGGNAVVHADPSINSLATAGDKLWIGTVDKGLFSFDGATVRAEIDHATLKSGAIWKIAPAADGSVWIAGQHGVFRVRDGNPERIVEVEDVRDAFIDGEHVWAATTTRGLMHIRRDERYGWLVSAFGFEQGLPSEKAFSIIRSDNDGLLIGTNRGVVTYKAGSIAPKLIVVRVLSQRVHDLGDLASKIELEYPQNSLLVEVAGQSSRTFPEEFQYAFVLKKANGDVVDTRISNDSQYAPADLEPGDYTIDVIAFNRDLLASDPLSISFSIARAPFPWTATALGVLLLLAIVGLIWAMIEHRRIAERNRELAAARLDLANEAERERRRIARDLHDQTLADLRSLMIKSDKFGVDKGEFRNEIEAVSTDIRRICEDLSPSVLENVGLVAALEFLLERTVDHGRFVADESVEDRIEFPLHVQLQIYRIAQEVLTNIVRHSNAAEVEMCVEAASAGEFDLTIRDDGSVFHADKAAARNGRGISNIRARANLINGRASWRERSGGGNTFRLRIDKNGDA